MFQSALWTSMNSVNTGPRQPSIYTCWANDCPSLCPTYGCSKVCFLKSPLQETVPGHSSQDWPLEMLLSLLHFTGVVSLWLDYRPLLRARILKTCASIALLSLCSDKGSIVLLVGKNRFKSSMSFGITKHHTRLNKYSTSPSVTLSIYCESNMIHLPELWQRQDERLYHYWAQSF